MRGCLVGTPQKALTTPEQTMGYPDIPSFGASETIDLCLEGTRDIVLMTLCNVVTKPKIAAAGVYETKRDEQYT
jgi:hypothetical protein